MSLLFRIKSNLNANGLNQPFSPCVDEIVGAKLEGVFFLDGSVGESPNFCSESFGAEEAEVAQSANANDGNFLSGPTPAQTRGQ
jgi:hypothetical protein